MGGVRVSKTRVFVLVSVCARASYAYTRVHDHAAQKMIRSFACSFFFENLIGKRLRLKPLGGVVETLIALACYAVVYAK